MTARIKFNNRAPQRNTLWFVLAAGRPERNTISSEPQPLAPPFIHHIEGPLLNAPPRRRLLQTTEGPRAGAPGPLSRSVTKVAFRRTPSQKCVLLLLMESGRHSIHLSQAARHRPQPPSTVAWPRATGLEETGLR
ncbi:unnamed protein product [Arctogadus glacialis]